MNFMILGEESIGNMWYISMVNNQQKFSYQATITAMQIQEPMVSA